MKSFTADSLTVRVYPTQAELAADAADQAHQILRKAVQDKGQAAAILASAASQVKFLEVFIRLKGLDWSRVTLFHMDEYLGIDHAHPASFRRFMRERVEHPLRPKAFHYL